MNIEINGARVALDFGDTVAVLTGTLSYPPAFVDEKVAIKNSDGVVIGHEMRKVARPRETPPNTAVIGVDELEALARAFLVMLEEKRKAAARRTAEAGFSNHTTGGK